MSARIVAKALFTGISLIILARLASCLPSPEGMGDGSNVSRPFSKTGAVGNMVRSATLPLANLYVYPMPDDAPKNPEDSVTKRMPQVPGERV